MTKLEKDITGFTGCFFVPGNGVTLGEFVSCIVIKDNGETLEVELELEKHRRGTIKREDFVPIYSSAVTNTKGSPS